MILAITNIPEAMARIARGFCRNTTNNEYVRGQAELLIDHTPGLSMEDKDEVRSWLVDPSPTVFPGLFIVAFSGGYEAPSYEAMPSYEEAMHQARVWAADLKDGDTIDVLYVDPSDYSIERVEVQNG